MVHTADDGGLPLYQFYLEAELKAPMRGTMVQPYTHAWRGAYALSVSLGGEEGVASLAGVVCSERRTKRPLQMVLLKRK